MDPALWVIAVVVQYVVWLGFNHRNPIIALLGVLGNGMFALAIVPDDLHLAQVGGHGLFMFSFAVFVFTICDCIWPHRKT